MENLYQISMRIGHRLGCHQLPERSFFIRGRQLPLCARCTGLVIGYAAAFVLLPFYRLPLYVSILFCELMLMDWLMQFLGVRESTNVRRVLSGTLCGYGLINAYAAAVLWVIRLITK